MFILAGCKPSAVPEPEAENYIFNSDDELNTGTQSKQATVNMLSANDDFGRTIDPIGGIKADKERYVGLFYFTWHGQHGGAQNGIYDISKLLNDNPDALWNANGTTESPKDKYHFWGEPMYGYYNSLDPWVIRKQLELFVYAGVDFLVFDCTNGFTYLDVISVILPIMEEYRLEGWNVPKFVFYLNSQGKSRASELYRGSGGSNDTIKDKGIYKSGKYKELWFAPNGKPMLIAITDPANTVNGPFEDHGITDPEILNFFEVKESQWPTTQKFQNGFPWIDFTRPQQAYGDVINISVAQHNLLPFSDVYQPQLNENNTLADNMWGRGWTGDTTASGTPDHSNNAIRSGKNFQQQWDTAFSKDLKYNFVTGWNEWIALKLTGTPGNTPYLKNGNNYRPFFVDTFNEEYSRDVEMMRNGYQDNFYLQMMQNIRRQKGAPWTMKAAKKQTIDILSGMKQWNSSENAMTYHNLAAAATNRNFKDFTGENIYKDDSVKNSIEEIRVTHDDVYIYVAVKTTQDISVSFTEANSMNLLLDIQGADNSRSMLGYEYLIGRSRQKTGEISVEALDYHQNKLTFAKKTSGAFSINGKYMQIKVPKASLGITGSFRINFKLTDNVASLTDVADYYTTGSVAPAGRLNFVFCG